MRERVVVTDEGGKYPLLDLMALGVRAREYLEACQEGKKLGEEWRPILERMNRFFEGALRGTGAVKTWQLGETSSRDLQAMRWSEAIEAKRAGDQQTPRRDLAIVLPQYQMAVEHFLKRGEVDSALIGEMIEFFTAMHDGAIEISAKPIEEVSINFEEDRLPTREQKEQEWLNRNIFGISPLVEAAVGHQIARRGSGTVADARWAMGEMAADSDIREGRVERFSTPQEAIVSLKR